MTDGRFIALEGGDGSGKTTQARLLAAALAARGYNDITVTREPGGTALGGQIRAALLHGGEVTPRAEALLYAADRAQHVAEVVAPALARGGIVLTDRYIDSSIAYQGEGRALPEAEVRAVNRFGAGGLQPDLTVLLDIGAETAGRRREAGRGGAQDRIEAAGGDFHRRVNARLAALAAADPRHHAVVDGSGPVEAVAEAVLAAVLRVLPAPGAGGGAGAGEAAR
ncbi:MAG: dTMP kinase [Bifidobacteriaceae bacterium]|nr:dTMP kinase [Bifidobacteriaceae bacterium]